MCAMLTGGMWPHHSPHSLATQKEQECKRRMKRQREGERDDADDNCNDGNHVGINDDKNRERGRAEVCHLSQNEGESRSVLSKWNYHWRAIHKRDPLEAGWAGTEADWPGGVWFWAPQNRYGGLAPGTPSWIHQASITLEDLTLCVYVCFRCIMQKQAPTGGRKIESLLSLTICRQLLNLQRGRRTESGTNVHHPPSWCWTNYEPGPNPRPQSAQQHLKLAGTEHCQSNKADLGSSGGVPQYMWRCIERGIGLHVGPIGFLTWLDPGTAEPWGGSVVILQATYLIETLLGRNQQSQQTHDRNHCELFLFHSAAWLPLKKPLNTSLPAPKLALPASSPSISVCICIKI